MSKNDLKTIPEMRHYVIDNSIRIEKLLDEIIQVDLGFEPEFSPDGKEIINLKQITKFDEEIIKKFNFPAKFNYVKKFAEKKKDKSFPDFYGKDWNRFIEIRNKFAHTLAPAYPLYKEGMVAILASDYERHSKKFDEWEKLSLEHTKLFKKLYELIFNIFYTKINFKN